MAARLKVFVTSNGLTDYVVATSSRPKALAAWGVSQDLFKEGAARETDDPALVEAALARPGEVLERPGGSRAALKAEAAKTPARRKPKGPSPTELRRRRQLEAKLDALDQRHKADLDDIAAEREALDAREARLTARYEDERDKLRKRLA